MKQLLFAFTLLCGMSLAACAQGQNNRTMKESSNVLVAYFSATGTTARAAQTLARVTGGELFAIVPQEAYTGADLDWHDKQSRSSVEMNDPKARPALKGKKEGMDTTSCSSVIPSGGMRLRASSTPLSRATA